MIDSFEAVVTIISVLVTGVVVQLANVYINNRKVTLNISEVAHSAATAVVGDMSQLIKQLKDELDRRELQHEKELLKRDQTIERLSDKVVSLEGQIRQMRLEMKSDTENIIREVQKS